MSGETEKENIIFFYIKRIFGFLIDFVILFIIFGITTFLFIYFSFMIFMLTSKGFISLRFELAVLIIFGFFILYILLNFTSWFFIKIFPLKRGGQTLGYIICNLKIYSESGRLYFSQIISYDILTYLSLFFLFGLIMHLNTLLAGEKKTYFEKFFKVRIDHNDEET